MGRFQQRSISTQVRWALAILALLTTVGSLGLLLLGQRASRSASQLYRGRLLPIQQLVEVNECYAVNMTFVLRAVRGGRMPSETGLEVLRENEARALRAWQQFRAARPATEPIQEAEASIQRLRALSLELEILLPAGVTPELGRFGDRTWLPEVVSLSRQLQGLREEEDRQARILIQDLETRSRRMLVMGLTLIAAVLALTLGFGRVFSAHLRRNVGSLVAHLRRVADGNLDPMTVEPGEGEFVLAQQELNRTVARLQGLMADLRSQQALQRTLLDSAPAAIIGMDLEGQVSHFNLGAERLLGRRAAETIGRVTPMVWRLPEEMAAMAEELSRQTGRPVAAGIEALQVAGALPGYSTECHFRAADGTLVPVLLTLSQIRTPDGELLGTMGVALDLRDLRRLREELRASEARYRLLAERLPDVVYQTQVWPDGRRAWPFVSPQFRAFYGEDAAVLEANPGYSLEKVHPDDRAGYLQALQEATARMGPMEWEGRSFTGRPGELKWVRVRRSPTPQADGSVLWDGVLEDISKLKQSEEALRLSEARAQEASRAKSAFLASMSHELRTPLSAILGYTRLMTREPGRSLEDQVQLGQVVRAGEHLLALINDVLSLSKIEAGRMELRPAVFSLADLLREMEALFGLSAQAKGLAFEVAAERLPPQVEGDLPKLRQVLVNLLGNALKFTAQGRVRLRVQWAGDAGRFRVEDTGPGIAPEDQIQIFSAFHQTALGHAASGTGLGLHISQSLVELMGGTLGLESRAGQGAAFHFTVPLPQPESPVILPSQGRVVRLAAGDLRRLVLIVDDRGENRDILDRLLSILGFDCILAEHGAAGLEQWRQQRPELILMDLRMPVMDGFEAVRRLRQEEAEGQLPRTPVVAISASVYDVSTEDLLYLGFDAFLIKPIDEEQLFVQMERLLGVRFERQAPGCPAPAAPVALDGLAEQEPGWRARFLDRVAVGDLEAAEALLGELADPALAEAAAAALRAYNLEDILQQLR